jgi:hypothetical protein
MKRELSSHKFLKIVKGLMRFRNREALVAGSRRSSLLPSSTFAMRGMASTTAPPSSLDFAAPIAAPSTYDVFFQDMSSSHLAKIGEELDSIALSLTSETPKFPINGILFG